MQRNGNDGRIKLNPLPLIVMVALLLIDQITKCFFHQKGENYEVVVIENFFKFSTVYNEGAAFGFLGNQAWGQIFFKILTVLAIVGFYLFYLFATFKEYKFLKYALILVFAGMIGNFIDRLAFNYVVDFLSFTFWGWDFAVFNVADVCLSVGVVMLVVHFLFLDQDAIFKKKDGKDNA